MIKRIVYPILYVTDMRRSLRFYRNTLGFTTVSDSQSFAEIELGGTQAALNIADGKTKVAGLQTIVLSSDDIESDYQKMKNSVGPTQLLDTDYGRTYMFLDPDGNKIEIVEDQITLQ